MSQSSPTPLPIDEVLPALRRALAGRHAAVLQAPPGAGKTTRVPLALLAEPWLSGQRILLLEPRRLAATNAARFMAAGLGEPAGKTVGYAIRYERCVSPQTRIEVVTEGILTRRLQADPLLEGVGLVIFDEFHERSLHSDLALALCRDAQLGLREELRLLVMSATLDGAPLARLLGEAPLVTSAGRSYPVEVRHLPRDPEGPAEEVAARAVRRALREAEGDLLVFLPGVREIRSCQRLLAAGPPLPGAPLLCPLYADLPFAEQERAILPGKRRRVVLATNIAETSLTIEGVRVVIDSGLARRPLFDPSSGLSRLETVRIAAASAAQRSGRAGRLAPGLCYRLWSEGTQGALLPFTPPEIRSADLAPLALELARWGVREATSLPWLDPPADGSLRAARKLLRELGALDDLDRLTRAGEAMAVLPTHPRLAALLTAAQRLGLGHLGCDLAALLSERDLYRREGPVRPKTDSDLLDRLELLRRWRRSGGGGAGVDAAACAAVERAARYWRRQLHLPPGAKEAHPDLENVARLLLAAYPDRLAKEREAGSGRYLLANGLGGRLSGRSGVSRESWLVAVDLAGIKNGEGLIHSASTVPEGLLARLYAERLVWQRRVTWDEREERVVAVEERRLGALLLASRPVRAGAEETLAALLAGVRQMGLDVLSWRPEARQLVARLRFLARLFPAEEWPDPGPQQLLAALEEWLGPYLAGVKNRAELSRVDLLSPLAALLDWPQRQRLTELAPTHLQVPSGSRILLDYCTGETPVMAVKLQELFGMAETPRIAGGRVPVLLHLLSPARRPMQVTADLRNFWDSVYPEVKKELKGRYPKHPWPDDPWTAQPTRGVKRR